MAIPIVTSQAQTFIRWCLWEAAVENPDPWVMGSWHYCNLSPVLYVGLLLNCSRVNAWLCLVLTSLITGSLGHGESLAATASPIRKPSCVCADGQNLAVLWRCLITKRNCQKMMSIASNTQPWAYLISLNLAINHLPGTRLWAVSFLTVQIYCRSIWDHNPCVYFQAEPAKGLNYFTVVFSIIIFRKMTTANGCLACFRCRSVLGQWYHPTSCEVWLW